jgi:hypothetical protein
MALSSRRTGVLFNSVVYPWHGLDPAPADAGQSQYCRRDPALAVADVKPSFRSHMKLIFSKVFTARSTRRVDDRPGNPVVVEVFENEGQRWIKALRLAPMLGISTYAIRNALKDRPELHAAAHNQLASLEGESGGPVRMLTIEGARRLAESIPKKRRFAVRKFLDETERYTGA